METTADRIRKNRILQGLTQKELAARINTIGAAISNYERGARRPKLETIIKIANALSVDVSALEPSLTWNSSLNETLNSDYAAYISVLFNSLNKQGVSEAIKRITELTQLPQYSK